MYDAQPIPLQPDAAKDVASTPYPIVQNVEINPASVPLIDTPELTFDGDKTESPSEISDNTLEVEVNYEDLMDDVTSLVDNFRNPVEGIYTSRVNVIVKKGETDVFNFELSMTGTKIRLTSNRDLSELATVDSDLDAHYADGVIIFRDPSGNFDSLIQWLQFRIDEVEDMTVLDRKAYSFEIAVDETIQLPSRLRLAENESPDPKVVEAIDTVKEIFDTIVFNEIPQEGAGLDLIKIIKGELPMDRITVTDVISISPGSVGSSTRTIGIFSREEQITIFYTITQSDLEVFAQEDGTVFLLSGPNSFKTIQCNMFYDPEGQMNKNTY
jgi:hypothetical protein